MDENCTAIYRVLQAALNRVNGRECTARWLRSRGITEALRLVAVGKAAEAMTLGACDVLGSQITEALLITKRGHAPRLERASVPVTLYYGGHPLPDEDSLVAGNALLRFVAASPPDGLLLFLLSGGASSLAEVLPPGVKLGDLVELNRWLIGSGLGIHEVNALRQRVSALKGGRLLERLEGRRALQLILSDVPGDRPESVGSGPLIRGDARLASTLMPRLPPWVVRLVEAIPPEAAGPDAVSTYIVASLRDAMRAAGAAAHALGYPSHVHAELITGDAVESGACLAETLCAARPGFHIWGGETVVRLPAAPGRGGRNQSLALSAAVALAGRRDVLFLALATDGTDGPGEDAGALVDGGSVARGEAAGVDPRRCLAEADAGRFLEASGDLIATGPTGTNVMDLFLGLRV